MARILVGIGGWTFEPWRGPFYPPDLPKAREIDYATRHVTSIEINATYYGSQKPESFRRWRDTAPDGFVYSLKGPRFATQRKDLTQSAGSIEHFLGSGITELGPKLGPLLWQFPPHRQYERGAFEGFLDMLPDARDGIPLRHVLEVRHPSFLDADFVALLRERGVTQAMVESATHPLIGDLTAPFVYLRLELNSEAEPEGYASDRLDAWAARFRNWVAGGTGTDLPLGAPGTTPTAVERDVFAYFISGDKVRAPSSAAAMLRRLGWNGPAADA